MKSLGVRQRLGVFPDEDGVVMRAEKEGCNFVVVNLEWDTGKYRMDVHEASSAIRTPSSRGHQKLQESCLLTDANFAYFILEASDISGELYRLHHATDSTAPWCSLEVDREVEVSLLNAVGGLKKGGRVRDEDTAEERCSILIG